MKMKTNAKVYLAAPLFNQREREFNEYIAGILEQNASVFLPQRDGSLLVNMLRAGVAQEVAERRIFEQDVLAMKTSNILIAVLDGGHIDEGVAFEIGYMHALGKHCVGLQTDIRRALPTGNNPMIARSLTHIFESVEPLSDWVAMYAQKLRHRGDAVA